MCKFSHNIWLILGFVCFLPLYVNGERVSRQIYHQLQGNITCFRRLNATHQTGCSSPRAGVVGVVMVFDGKWDIDWLLENGTRGPYIIALYPKDFVRSVLMKLNASPKITGVILLKLPDSHPDGFSPDVSCPNQNYGIYNTSDKFKDHCSAKKPWNSEGTGLMFENYNFPIILLNQQNEVKYITKNCYDKYNKLIGRDEKYWPLCAAQIKTPMFAAVDSRTCMRRTMMLATSLQPLSMCEPLQDKNIYSSLVATNKSEPFTNKSVLVLSARLDAASMFEGMAPGVETTVSALVSAMAVAEVLSKYQDEFREKNKNLFYLLLHGEVFDYIGSSRLMYDMEKDRFPQKLDEDVNAQMPLLKSHHISHWLELNQVSFRRDSLNKTSSLFMHSDPVSTKDEDVNKAVSELKDAIKAVSKDVDLDVFSASDTLPLPPASLQRVLWADNKVPGVVMSNYEEVFDSPYYNSVHDAPFGVGYVNLLTVHLEKVVTLTARAVYKLALGEDPPSEVHSNNETIKEMLMCYIISPNCTMWRRIYPGWLPPHPLPLYVSVKSAHSSSWLLRHLTHNTLAYLTGQYTNLTEKDCKNRANDQIHHYFWVEEEEEDGNNTGICMNSTVHSKVAQSPAFVIKDYDFSSGEYSTWTESVWENPSARLFLKPSWNQEATIFGVGSTVLVLSFVLTYLIKKRANVLFPQG